MVWYKTLRHKQFQSSKFGKQQMDKTNIVPIEYLLSELKTGNVCVMGLITQLVEDQYSLEDTTGTIKIDFNNIDFQDTFIMEGCIVIVNGVYKDDVLYIENINFPPIESSESMRSDFGDSNTFGGPHNLSLKMSEKLQVHEENNPDGMIVFIAELWLDMPNVLQKFKTMLEGYMDYPPIAFVLCGHFLSFPTNITSAQALITGFKNLTDIITQYTNVKESSKFVFVPGPHDLGSPKILPKPPLPKCIIEEVTKIVPNAIFTTNPCRIQYCTKEIVVLREDMLTKMCRNALRFPKEEHFFKHFAKTIISQSHLTPVPLQVVPIYWKYDHALQVFPTPDLIVIADNFGTYTTDYSDCYVINPGMFSKNNFSFQVYVPAINQIQDCQLPNDTDVS
ncbi:hypothetical protein ACFW04_002988 [Cataglyphis niger]